VSGTLFRGRKGVIRKGKGVRYPFGVNDTVYISTTGITTNAQLRGDPLNTEAAAQNGIQDPFNILHEGNDSWFIGGLGDLFGFDVGHVVEDPNGISAHYDDFGPLNPLHYMIQLPAGIFSTPQTTYTCSTVGGCSQ
jgi:hypothetical protein